MDLDERWLGHPGYSLLLSAALVALADPLPGRAALRALVIAFAAVALAVTVLMVHRDRLSARLRRAAPPGLCLASAALAFGVLEVAGHAWLSASRPATLGLLAMAVGAYVEHVRAPD